MSYRDDRDADQARIAALERELADARTRIDELEGKESKALVLASPGALVPGGPAPTSASKRWLGAPLQLQRSHTFDRALGVEHFEPLVDRIRALTGDTGRTELMPTSLTWRSSGRGVGPRPTVTVIARNGVTTLTVVDDLGAVAGFTFGAIGGAIGVSVTPVFVLAVAPVLAPLLVVGWLGGMYAGVRTIYRAAARRRAVGLQRLFDALVDEIERALG